MNDGELKAWFYNNYSHCETKFDECHQLMLEWIQNRRMIIAEIESVVRELEKHNKNTNISTVVGASAGAAGGALALGGVLMAPGTAGISLAISITGLVVGGVGALTRMGSKIFASIITKRRCKQVQAKLDADIALSQQLKCAVTDTFFFCTEFLTMLQENELVARTLDLVRQTEGGIRAEMKLKTWTFLTKLAQEVHSGDDDARNFKFGVNAILVGRMSRAVLLAASQGLRVVRTTLGVVGIGLDIWELVSTGVDLRKGSKSRATDRMKEVIEELRNELNEIQSLLPFLNETPKEEVLQMEGTLCKSS